MCRNYIAFKLNEFVNVILTNIYIQFKINGEYISYYCFTYNFNFFF